MPAAESGSVLAAERTHLAKSRAALRQMREHTAGLTAIGGDHVSTEHLKQALYRRMKALEDSPTFRCSSAGWTTTRPMELSRTKRSTSGAAMSPGRQAANLW